ncbi:nuclease [Batrachochytrium salamandrivorans]|nr:nuclease [Batrachochytrium salamandrivorans]
MHIGLLSILQRSPWHTQTEATQSDNGLDSLTPDRSRSKFKEEDGVPARFRSKLTDYSKSGFDRGHLVPAADVRESQKAVDETFISLTDTFDNVFVTTGPLFLPTKDENGQYWVKYQVLGTPPNTAVPTHFFKVIVATRKDQTYAQAFVVPNSAIEGTPPLTDYIVPVDAVEHMSGLSLFPNLDAGSYRRQPQSPQETIDKLCDRVMHSSLLEDRRAAVRDCGDLQGTGNCLVLKRCRCRSLRHNNDVGIMFTEIYTKDAANVTLLDILAELDFYVRLDTVQFLTTLLQNNGPHLQDCVLTSPMGISRLIDLWMICREIIRNELIQRPAVSNSLGVFCSKVLSQDHQGAVDLPLTHERTEWTDQKIANVNSVMELVCILVAPKNPNTVMNQAST